MSITYKATASICKVDGCEFESLAKGYCSAHYARSRRGKMELSIPVKVITARGKCSINGCERQGYAGGLCNPHYQRRKRHGAPLAGGIVRRTKGSGNISKDGYRYLFIPGHPNASKNGSRVPSKVLEHRYVMSQLLGRPLLKGETVHHKDGNKLNNQPDNLELWVSSHPGGQRVDDLVAWAKAIIDRYESVLEVLKR